jgi:anti-sigma-K factor RskA
MNYRDPELQQRLAYEYALGALQGRARRRFERLLEELPELRRQVTDWQERLVPLAEETAPVTPPSGLLPRLLEKIEPVQTISDEPLSWWQRLAFWRGLSLGSTALAAGLALLIGIQSQQFETQPLAEPLYVGLLDSSSAGDTVVVFAYGKPWRLSLETPQPLEIPAGSELRVWSRESDGKMRLLAATQTWQRVIRISTEKWDLLKRAQLLSVTLDPVGSASDAPATKALFTGRCVSLDTSSEP